MHLLDKGWDIIITSDHGLFAQMRMNRQFHLVIHLVLISVMEELGYTVMKKDENGSKAWRSTGR